MYPDEDPTLNRFTKWLRNFADHRGYKYVEQPSNGNKYIT